MLTAVFPFQIERFDDMQGVFGRQIARRISDGLAAAGVRTDRVQWFSRSGEQLTHVALESPFPANVLREELEDRGADAGVIGHVSVRDGNASLQVAVVAPMGPSEDATDVFNDEGPRDALPQMVQRATHAIVAKLTGHTPQTDIDDVDFATWRDALLQADQADLEHHAMS